MEQVFRGMVVKHHYPLVLSDDEVSKILYDFYRSGDVSLHHYLYNR